jgi:hypothetical protein
MIINIQWEHWYQRKHVVTTKCYTTTSSKKRGCNAKKQWKQHLEIVVNYKLTNYTRQILL